MVSITKEGPRIYDYHHNTMLPTNISPDLRSNFEYFNARFSRIVIRIISLPNGMSIGSGSSILMSKTSVAVDKVCEFQGLRGDKPIRVN